MSTDGSVFPITTKCTRRSTENAHLSMTRNPNSNFIRGQCLLCFRSVPVLNFSFGLITVCYQYMSSKDVQSVIEN